MDQFAVFVWTIRDAVSLALLALMALCFALYGVLVALDALERWVRRKIARGRVTGIKAKAAKLEPAVEELNRS